MIVECPWISVNIKVQHKCNVVSEYLSPDVFLHKQTSHSMTIQIKIHLPPRVKVLEKQNRAHPWEIVPWFHLYWVTEIQK